MYNYTKLKTDLFGLKFRPTLGDQDDLDCIHWITNPPKEFSTKNGEVLKEELIKLIDCRCIVEIGVHRNGQDSSTDILLKYKPRDCVYLGVDIDYKGYLDNKEENIYTIQCDSMNRAEVYQQLESLGCKEIDLLFIDGWHSINHSVNDWTYAERLSKDGVVLMHDMTMHPCLCTYDAIDENLFEKKKYFTDPSEKDFGIAVIKWK